MNRALIVDFAKSRLDLFMYRSKLDIQKQYFQAVSNNDTIKGLQLW